MKLIRKVYTQKKKEYLDSKGKKVTRCLEMYFIEFDNGFKVAVKPIFKEGYISLNAFAEKVYDQTKLDVTNTEDVDF